MLLLLLASCSEYGLDGKADPSKAAQPEIVVTPASLDFGKVAPFCVVDRSMLIENVGEAPLNVDAVTFEGDTEITATSVATMLETGESAPFNVRFLPESNGDFVGDLIVHSDDPDTPKVHVPTVAAAGPDYTVEDDFVQPASLIDVLWVIDNSSSMQQEQARVVAGISTFFASFDALGVNYHMGVVTTDIVQPQYSGSLVGDPRYIDATTVDAQTKLSANINIGDTAQGNESGLKGVELALSEPLISGYNAGFYRPDAQLAIVFLSDEPEQSADDAQHYIDFLTALKSDPSRITVSAIVGDETAGCANVCDGADQTAEPGDKYVAVSRAFNGVFGSICTCDITPYLQQIGEDATALIRSYPLSQTPSDSAGIEVYVDGSAVQGFTYDAAANKVELASAPAEGASVTVRYGVPTTCTPM